MQWKMCQNNENNCLFLSENCTYFTSSAVTTGSSCSITICKCSSNVCQLRLDFETFALNNPVNTKYVWKKGNYSHVKVTVTTITVGTVGPVGAAGSANRIGNCDTDSFSVTTPGGKAPPLICGTNTGNYCSAVCYSLLNSISRPAHVCPSQWPM